MFLRRLTKEYRNPKFLKTFSTCGRLLADVNMPHEIKGQGIYAFVTLKVGVEKSDVLKKELVTHVRKQIGHIATPDKLQFADALPKIRSGKIMRRILTKIGAGDVENLGDITTLADPSVVKTLVKGAQRRVKIDLERCDGCGDCVEECPMDVFQIVDGKAQAVNEQDCTICYLYETVCFELAITIIDNP